MRYAGVNVKKKILIVNDKVGYRETLHRLLAQLYELDMAEDAKEALVKLHENI